MTNNLLMDAITLTLILLSPYYVACQILGRDMVNHYLRMWVDSVMRECEEEQDEEEESEDEAK